MKTTASRGLTPVEWTICAVAALGFAFDIYELLMLPLIVGPALTELGGIRPGSPEFNQWVGLLFYVPAVAGGVFGLLGGYLTDRFGRRRARKLRHGRAGTLFDWLQSQVWFSSKFA